MLRFISVFRPKKRASETKVTGEEVEKGFSTALLLATHLRFGRGKGAIFGALGNGRGAALNVLSQISVEVSVEA